MSVNLADLPLAARRVSTAILPPVSHLAALVAAILFIVGYDAIVNVFSVHPADLMPSDAAVKAIEFYGLAAIAPIVAGVLILVFAHGVQSGLTWLGSRLPPHLSSNTTIQMHAAADAWTLRRIWILHPEFHPVDSLNMLNVATDEAVAQAEVDAKAHHRLRQVVAMRDRAVFHRAQMRFTKGFLVVTLVGCFTVVCAGGGLAPVGRFANIAALCVAWAFYQGVRLIESEHAYFRAKIETYLEVQEASRAKPLEPHVGDAARDTERLKELKQWLAGMPAWSLSWSHGEDDIKARKQLVAAIRRFVRQQ